MFGGVNVWQIAEFKVIGKIKFSEWIDFGHWDTKIWLVKVWQITDDLPNLTNFSAAKHSHYTIVNICTINLEIFICSNFSVSVAKMLAQIFREVIQFIVHMYIATLTPLY